MAGFNALCVEFGASIHYNRLEARCINMNEMKKAVVSVLGNDQRGIIARVTKILYEYDVNILDISQTIRMGIFNMMMIVDTNAIDIPYDEFIDRLKGMSSEIGVDIRCQKEKIFDMMHRI